MAIVAPISGSFSDRIGTRIPTVFGMVVLSIGIYLMSGLGPTTSIYQIGIVLAIVGLGTGTFISPNNSAIMGAAPQKRQGIAAGLLATARSTGMVLGVGLAGAIFTTILESAVGQSSIYIAFSTSLVAAAGFAALGAFFSAIKK
jgi:MFS family permease